MELGKISIDILKKHIFNEKFKKDEVLLYPDIGEDCAAVDMKEDIAVVTCDPITATDKFSGYLSVVVVCNDLAATGAEPVGVLSTVLLPPTSTQEDFISILTQIKEACKRFDIVLLGGHSEVSRIVNKPLIVSMGLGRVKKSSLVSSKGAKPHDKIIITKTLGIEGSFILYHHRKNEILKLLTTDEVKEIENFFNKLSVVEEGLIAREYATSMHDITEGGLFGAIFEVCSASKKGARIYENLIKLNSAVRKITSFFGLDPYRLISSGSMLITTNRENELIKALEKKGIDCHVIGEVTEDEKIEFIHKNGDIAIIDNLTADEIYKVV